MIFPAAVAQKSAGYAFAAVDSMDRAIFAADAPEVKMIVFAVACDQFGLDVAIQLGEDAPQVADCRF
ncbi:MULTISPECIES: hypothetical protein [Rhizobium]|uniref:hypothetical protein n=1 Tax=Rhizobium sp. SEMIA 4085 TaxID=2137761 RepID=UPI000587F106|nr:MULTISPECIES: hypothetical protein [Rhizobium]